MASTVEPVRTRHSITVCKYMLEGCEVCVWGRGLCVCVCVCACVRACVCVCVHACMNACVYVCEYVYTCGHVL